MTDFPDVFDFLDTAISELGTLSASPFPPTPNPNKPPRAISNPGSDGASGNGRDAGPDHRDRQSRSGTGNPLFDKESPASPDGPAPQKDHHEKHKTEVGTGNGLPIPTSVFPARVKYQKDRDYRDHRDQTKKSVIEQKLGTLCLGPDPENLVPMIGTSVDDFDERAAILEYDGGHERPDAEALAFAECIASACGCGASASDQLLAARRLHAEGIPVPPRWSPSHGR